MECNKDEALRAREIAEKKMSSNDFQGAKKIALKAQNLYPELDNISQLLNVCDVHCSAQQGNLGSEKDWYGILQVDRMADQMTIKKQYRRLALVLHPDKNRFPGAEAAFKLISEAHAILSDSAKKSVYDSKIRVLGRSAPVNPPPQHVSHQFNKQTVNGTSGSKQSEVFWTRCPLCNTTYQYPRTVVNRVLKCPKCSKPFMGTEVNPQSVPSGKWTHLPSRSGSSQPAAFHEKVVPEPSSFNMNVQNGKGPPAPQARSTGVASKIPVQPGPGFQAGGGSKAVPAAGTFKEYLKANSTKANSSRGFNEGEKLNDVAVNKESRNSKNKSMKTGKNRVVESSDDSDTTTGSRFKGVTSNTPATDLKSGPCQVPLQRKSSRRKQNVSYNEGDDDDFSTPPKRSKTSSNREDDLEEQKVGPDSESLKDGGEGDAEAKSKEGTVLPEDKLRKKGPSEIVDVSDSDNDDSENVKLEFPDPEFNDFEKERDESCFKVDQYWACYDSFDGMPRFYARVQKVSTSPFEVSFRWLEAMPIDEEFEDWVEEDMPVSCGTFKLGKPDKVSERETFSHEVKNITKVTKSKKRGTLFIYPEKSEIWAIFKDWDMSWSAEPENHKKPKYEIVEVLSDFDEGTGVRVGYLDKVQGFVSLFQRASESEDDSFVIKPSELYKFSHKILSFKMSGSEREGVPKGSFELDPASLPENPNDLHFPVKAKVQQSGTVPGVYPSTPLSKKGKSADEVPMVRRSPRGLNLGR